MAGGEQQGYLFVGKGMLRHMLGSEAGCFRARLPVCDLDNSPAYLVERLEIFWLT